MKICLFVSTEYTNVTQSWSWVGSIHGFCWVGLGQSFLIFGGSGWVGDLTA